MNKKFITKSAMILTATAGIATASNLQEIVQLPIVGTIGLVSASAAEVTDVDVTGTLTHGLEVPETHGQTTTIGGDIKFNINQDVKSGDTLSFRTNNYWLTGLNEVKIGDTVVGTIKKTGDSGTSGGFARNQPKIDAGENVGLTHWTDYEITFNDKIENMTDKNIEISFVNQNSNLGRRILETPEKYTLSTEFNGKDVATLDLTNLGRITRRADENMNNQINWVQDWNVFKYTPDGSIEGDNNVVLNFVSGTDEANNKTIKKGDIITWEKTQNDGWGWTTKDEYKLGDILEGADTKDYILDTHGTNDEGYIQTRKPYKFKITEVTPNKVSIEIVEEGDVWADNHIDKYLRTVLYDTSSKTVDLENNRMQDSTVNATITRGGSKIYERDITGNPRISGVFVNADGKLVEKGSVNLLIYDTDGNQLVEPIDIHNLVDLDTPYDVKPEDYIPEGYVLDKLDDGSAPLSGKTNNSLQTIKLIVKKDNTDEVLNEEKKIKTRFVDENGNDISDPLDGEHDKKDIPGYTYQGTDTDENGNVTHKYTKNPETKPQTRFVDEDGNDIIDPLEGEHDKKDIPGYTYQGTDTDENGNIVHKYIKDKVEKIPFDTEYIDDPNLLEGEEVVDQEGEEGEKINDVVTKEPKNRIIRRGTKQPDVNKIITKFVDENGNNIADPIEDLTEVGQKDIPGYTFKETLRDENGNVTHTYTKDPETKPLTTRFIDKNGKDLVDPITDTKVHDAKDIPGYRLVDTVKDEDGNVSYIYAHESEFTTDFVDENGNKIQDTIVDKETHGQKEIPGYTFKETVTDENGNVKHVYVKDQVLTPNTTNKTQQASTTKLPSTGATTGILGMIAGLPLVGFALSKFKKKD